MISRTRASDRKAWPRARKRGCAAVFGQIRCENKKRERALSIPIKSPPPLMHPGFHEGPCAAIGPAAMQVLREAQRIAIAIEAGAVDLRAFHDLEHIFARFLEGDALD